MISLHSVIVFQTMQRKALPMTTKTTHVRLPEPQHQQIEELAKATARTKRFLAVDALANCVQYESWHVRDIHAGLQEADAGDFASDAEVKAVFAKYDV